MTFGLAEEEINPFEVVKSLGIESRFSIYLYLLIYRELTLDDLSELMSKSKSTIHHHIQDLIDKNIIEVYTKPGSKTKYYRLILLRTDVKTNEIFDLDVFKSLSDRDKKARLLDLFSFTDNFAMIMQNMLNIVPESHKHIIDDVIAKRMDVSEAYNISQNFTLGMYFASKDLGEEFYKDIREMLKKYYDREELNPDQERPIAYMIMGVNIKSYLDRKYMIK